VESGLRLGDGGTGSKIFPGALRDGVDKFMVACDCCSSNLESFRASLTLRTSGDWGVPGAEGMGLIRVRFELDNVFLVDRLAAHLIAGFEIPLLSLPIVWAALNGVPGVPIDEKDKGGTPDVPMLAESKGLKVWGVSGNVWRRASTVVEDPSGVSSKESRLLRTTLVGCGRDGNLGADGINLKSRISGEDIPDDCGFEVAGLAPSVE